MLSVTYGTLALLLVLSYFHLILKMALRRDFYLPFTEEETEAKRMVTPEATYLVPGMSGLEPKSFIDHSK